MRRSHFKGIGSSRLALSIEGMDDEPPHQKYAGDLPPQGGSPYYGE